MHGLSQPHECSADQVQPLFFAVRNNRNVFSPNALEFAHTLGLRLTEILLAASSITHPCLPFVRPFGGTVRRRSVPASTVPLFARPLTEEQIDEVSVKAEELLKAQQFVQAADLVADALSRTTDPAAANELTFKLANVKWLGGSFTEAAKLFERTADYWTRRYGPDDPDARIARFFMAKCRAEMGAVTSAIEAFQNYVVSSPDSDDDEAIDRYLDALASLVRLHAASEHPEHAHDAASAFRQAASRYRGATSPILADLDAYVARLDRLLPGT